MPTFPFPTAVPGLLLSWVLGAPPSPSPAIQSDPLQEAGFSSALPGVLSEIARDAIEKGATPGMALAIGRRGSVVLSQGYGHLDWAGGSEEATDSSLYDLASLTKPLTIGILTMQMITEGRLALDDRVSALLPGWPSTGPAAAITIHHLLTHRSGLPAAPPSLARVADQATMISSIARFPIRGAPGRHEAYSDTGMLLLGLIVEHQLGKPLEELFAERVAQPMELRETTFRPLRTGIPPSRIAPTEKLSGRGHLRGEVHDPVASRLGGVAGHAGLFGSARDIALVLQHFAKGTVPGVCPSVTDTFLRRRSLDDRFALGFDTPSLDSSAGEFFSALSYGHTGYTGASFWVDPVQEVFVVLLTNRVNPSARNQKHVELRKAIHDTVQRAIVDTPSGPRVLTDGNEIEWHPESIRLMAESSRVSVGPETQASTIVPCA